MCQRAEPRRRPVGYLMGRFGASQTSHLADVVYEDRWSQFTGICNDGRPSVSCPDQRLFGTASAFFPASVTEITVIVYKIAPLAFDQRGWSEQTGGECRMATKFANE